MGGKANDADDDDEDDDGGGGSTWRYSVMAFVLDHESLILNFLNGQQHKCRIFKQ